MAYDKLLEVAAALSAFEQVATHPLRDDGLTKQVRAKLAADLTAEMRALLQAPSAAAPTGDPDASAKVIEELQAQILEGGKALAEARERARVAEAEVGELRAKLATTARPK